MDEETKQTCARDYAMRQSFENFIFRYEEIHSFDNQGINQLLRLASHWVMFMNEKEKWKAEIDKIEEALNFLK